MRTLSIAALQTAPVARDPEATLERLAKRAPAVRAAVPHAQLLVLPELHLAAVPGLLDEGEGYAESVAVGLPNTLTDRLGANARETKLWIVAGSVYERGDDGQIHNTASHRRAGSPLATARSSPGARPSTPRPRTASSHSTSPALAGSGSPSVTTASSPR